MLSLRKHFNMFIKHHASRLIYIYIYIYICIYIYTYIYIYIYNKKIRKESTLLFAVFTLKSTCNAELLGHNLGHSILQIAKE